MKSTLCAGIASDIWTAVAGNKGHRGMRPTGVRPEHINQLVLRLVHPALKFFLWVLKCSLVVVCSDNIVKVSYIITTPTSIQHESSRLSLPYKEELHNLLFAFPPLPPLPTWHRIYKLGQRVSCLSRLHKGCPLSKQRLDQWVVDWCAWRYYSTMCAWRYYSTTVGVGGWGLKGSTLSKQRLDQ